MKYIFKLITTYHIMGQVAFGREIILVEIPKESVLKETIVKVLTKNFNFPEQFISFKTIQNKCSKNIDSVLSLCVDTNEEIHITHINYFVLDNSLSEFTKQN